MTDDDMEKPQVGIASVWYEGNPCNMHLLDLAEKVKEGVKAAGMVGMRFNTIGVSDGISMGTDGMSYSLQSRDLIADSIETVMGAQWYDANISHSRLRQEHAGLPDRDGPPEPAVAHGLRRHDSGRAHSDGQKLDVVSAFQSYGEYLAGKIDENRRQRDRASRVPRRRRLRRHVHGQHDGLGDRSAGHVAALQLVDSGRGSAASSTSASARARRSAICSSRISSRATS